MQMELRKHLAQGMGQSQFLYVLAETERPLCQAAPANQHSGLYFKTMVEV